MQKKEKDSAHPEKAFSMLIRTGDAADRAGMNSQNSKKKDGSNTHPGAVLLC
jgi:hypothetical protein